MKKSTSFTIPARGPIRLDVNVPATADHCGVRVEVRLDAKQADTVRQAARTLGMDTLAFILAVFDAKLPNGRNLTRENVAHAAHEAGLRIACEQPGLRSRIERVAAYYGHASAEDYLRENFCRQLAVDELDMVVDPRTGQPAGNSALWKLVNKHLNTNRREYVADPLEHPGFLDRFKDRQPRACDLLTIPHEFIEDTRLEPAMQQARAA